MTNCEHLIENALLAIRAGDDDFKESFDKEMEDKNYAEKTHDNLVYN